MRKFTDVFDVNDYEVLTDVGYKDIKNVMKTVPYAKFNILFENGKSLECADDHLLIDEFGLVVKAKDSLKYNIKTADGLSQVIEVIDCHQEIEMFDIELYEHHLYYTNGILSHNTTIVAGYLMHLALFSENYTIALLANKRAQANEILSRIKLMYENLPWWLQVGVRRWNTNDILLDNGKKGTSIFTAATTGSSVRGKSLNCVTGESIVTVQDVETGEEYEIDIASFSQILEDLNSIEE